MAQLCRRKDAKMNILFDRIGRIPRLMRNCAPWIILCVSASALRAQPSLQITSPADGAVVYSGRTFVVKVEASPGAFKSVAVIAEDPIEDPAGLLYAPPYQFTLRIPPTTASHIYHLGVLGTTTSGEGVNSEITIDVRAARSASPDKECNTHSERELHRPDIRSSGDRDVCRRLKSHSHQLLSYHVFLGQFHRGHRGCYGHGDRGRLRFGEDHDHKQWKERSGACEGRGPQIALKDEMTMAQVRRK